MKYCSHCGKQIADDVAFCPYCGSNVVGDTYAPVQPVKSSSGNETLRLVAKIFMLISTILMGICIFPLAWAIPMTVTYWRKVEDHEPVSTGFKVCSLLFVSVVAGVLMLCDNDQ